MPAPAPGDCPAALVTDAAQPIGRAIALALAQRGYAVAVQAQPSHVNVSHLVLELAAAGGRVAAVEVDLADHVQVLRLVPAAAREVGPLTLLVNTTAEFAPDAIGQLERERFDRHVAVNLRAPIFLAEAFAAQVPAGSQAAIVNLLDRQVLAPTPRFLSAGLTASALHRATTALAQALAPRIRVNAVTFRATPPSPAPDAPSSTQQADAVDAVLYLASAASVTGATIALDGGQGLDRRPAGGAGP